VGDMLRVSWSLGLGRMSKWFTLPDQKFEAQELIGKLQSAGIKVSSQRVTGEQVQELMREQEQEEDSEKE